MVLAFFELESYHHEKFSDSINTFPKAPFAGYKKVVAKNT